MTCGDLEKFTSKYPPEDKIGILVIDEGYQLHYEVNGYNFVNGAPILVLMVGNPGPLDDFISKAALQQTGDDDYTE